MKYPICIFTLLFCQHIAFAQWSDDFSDGDFENNPSWRGNTGHFIVEDGWLRLNAPAAAGTSYLAVASDMVVSATWEFVFRMDFRPSSSNYAKVYLTSDRETLNSPLNGYYLRLGYTERDICLFRQNGNVNEKLITGHANTLDATSSHVRVLVTRDNEGLWTLKTDLAGGRDFTVEGSAQDRLINPSAFFGVACIYTATRNTGFYFGDFRVDGLPYTDIRPPVVLSYQIEGKQLNIVFSKPLAEISEPFDRFFNLDDRMHLEDVRMDEPSTVTLLLTDELGCGLRHNATIREIRDTHGNMMRDTTLFLIVPCRALPYDIVINEIMANPTPSVRLPEYEYVELYNRSNKNIEMDGWTFTYGNTTRTIPSYLFPAGGYLLLVHAAAVPICRHMGQRFPL